MTEEKNSMGGNCPQERLDSIKTAWEQRYGLDSWNPFIGATESRQAPIGETAENQSVTLCPTAEELCFRYKSRAKYHLGLARKYGRSPKGLRHFEDGMFYTNLARIEWARHNKIIRMIRGGV